jgi:D-glycero-D-manno-heptose 1,7-bisphosphate phosphatase
VLPLKQQTLDEMYLIPGADEAVRLLLAAGFVCPVVTIQSRIEKGLFAEQHFREWFAEFFRKDDLDVKGPYLCPHRYSHPCPCKKRNSLLYEQAAQDPQLSLSDSCVIGDSAEDVQAAVAFGGTGCLVRTGRAVDNRLVEAMRPIARFIGLSIAEAANRIISQEFQ